MSQKSKGILCILSSAFFFALMSLFVNLSGNVPVIQKSFFRNIVAAVISFVILVRSKEKVTMALWAWRLTLPHPKTGAEMVFCALPAVEETPWADFTAWPDTNEA